MNTKLLTKSLIINGVLMLLAAALVFLLASRAQNWEDLVYVSVMLYITASFFIANLCIAIVQALRRKEWLPHVIAAFAVTIWGLLLLFLAKIF